MQRPKRQRRGKNRPAPMVFRVVNAGSVHLPDRHSQANWQRALYKPGRFGRPDLVAGCEMGDVDVKAESKPIALSSYQRNVESTGENGLAVVSTRGYVSNCRLIRAVGPTSEGGGFKGRYILRGVYGSDQSPQRDWGFSFAVAHAHAPRAEHARAEYLRVLQGIDADIIVGDLNLTRKQVQQLFPGRTVISSGVIHVIIKKGVPFKRAVLEGGSDHLYLDILLFP